MTKARIALLGSAMMGLLLGGVGLAQAQDYSPGYYANGAENVIVRPDYYHRGVGTRQLLGRINGEVNPTEFSLSQRVDFGDLDLSRRADRMELRDRVHDTARNLCAEMDARLPELRGYPSEDRECVRNATREAMRDVRYARG